MPVFALELDTSIDDDIRRNYNPSKIDDDMALPSLPKILKTNSHNNVKPISQVQAPAKVNLGPKINPSQSKPLAQKQYKTAIQKSPSASYAKLAEGTKIRLKLLDSISDKTSQGTKLSFASRYPVSTTYFTIPMGTVFKGEVIDSHKPQLTGNGGLLVIKINSMIINNEIIPINACVTEANFKRIYFNNIKGKRKYLSSLFSSTKPGCHFFKKMMSVSSSLAQDGSSIVVAPFSLLIGVAAFAGNVIASPVFALFYKGGHIYIREGSDFEVKLLEDTFIYK